MEFIVIGDLHIKSDNFDEIDIVLSELKKIIRKEENELRIVLLGDILHYHEKIFVQSLNRALDFITECSKIAYTYILVGNHDYKCSSEFLTQNHWMNALKCWKNIKIVDTVVDEGDFLLCPYVFPGRFIEALDSTEWKNKKIIFAHQEFKGCRMGAIVSEDGDEWNENFPLVVSGHIHDTQEIYGGKIYYPGAPLQHTFGDVEKRIVCKVVLNDIPEIKEYHLNVPKKHIIHSDIKNIVKKSNESGDNDKIKVKLSATSDEFKIFKETSEYKEMIQKGIKIQHIPESNINYEQEKSTLIDLNFLKVLNDLVAEDDEEVQKLFKELF